MTEPVRAVIVDDEPAGREAIVTLLADEPAIVIAGEAGNGNEAVEVVRQLKPDLLFLDIQMPDRDGFGVIEALGPDVPRGIIFVTAHDQHAIRAFEVHALDYVLKPFGRPRFHAAVTRALERLSAHDALTLQRTLASMANDRQQSGEEAGTLSQQAPPAPQQRPQRLAVRTGAKVVLVTIADIDWIEACGDYVRIHAGRESHIVSESMRALEDLLDPREFLRIHRSVIVQSKNIRELNREADGGGAVTLQNGVRLRVARSRWDALESALGIAGA